MRDGTAATLFVISGTYGCARAACTRSWISATLNGHRVAYERPGHSEPRRQVDGGHTPAGIALVARDAAALASFVRGIQPRLHRALYKRVGPSGKHSNSLPHTATRYPDRPRTRKHSV